MARVRILWDGGEAVEYEGSIGDMQYLAKVIVGMVACGWLALCSKGAGDLQYETGQRESFGDLASLISNGDQGDQLDLEDAIKEVKDNGC